MFSAWWLELMVQGGLVLVIGAAVTLVALWLRDLSRRRLW